MAVLISLHKVLIFAPDLEVARHFYGDLLGLGLKRAEESFLSFQGSDFGLTIFACDRPTQPEGYSEQAGSSIAFAVESLDAAVSELAARGDRKSVV